MNLLTQSSSNLTQLVSLEVHHLSPTFTVNGSDCSQQQALYITDSFNGVIALIIEI